MLHINPYVSFSTARMFLGTQSLNIPFPLVICVFPACCASNNMSLQIFLFPSIKLTRCKFIVEARIVYNLNKTVFHRLLGLLILPRDTIETRILKFSLYNAFHLTLNGFKSISFLGEVNILLPFQFPYRQFRFPFLSFLYFPVKTVQFSKRKNV